MEDIDTKGPTAVSDDTPGHITRNQNRHVAHQFDWRYTLVALGYCVAVTAIFYQTAWSMVAIWWRSETFVHGFLIVPIVSWLIWTRRDQLAVIRPSPEYRVVILLVAAGLFWLFGYLMQALVIQQLAFVALIVSGLWLILGSTVIWTIAFPLAFLFLAVPVGEGLIPVLMEFTASFTVSLLKLTGVPVYREGMFFSLPSGNWSVVEGCSGVRYLIASFTLGCLFAYLTYRSLLKRLIFLGASIVVPIVANGFRAYMIVMIGHVSDMKLATGVDHLIYGWVFFGLVMFILFGVGSIWRDPDPDRVMPDSNATLHPENGAAKGYAPFSVGALALVTAFIWPLTAYVVEHQQTVNAVAPLEAPTGRNDWMVIDEQWQWRPVVKGADEEMQQFYRRGSNASEGGHTVGVYIGQFLAQDQGKELINSQNVFVVQKSPHWRITSEDKVLVTLKGKAVEVDRAVVKGSGVHLMVLRWYRLGDEYTANPYLAKLRGGLAKLTFARQDSAYITVALAVEDDPSQSLDILRDFIEVMLPALEDSLDRVVGEIGG